MTNVRVVTLPPASDEVVVAVKPPEVKTRVETIAEGAGVERVKVETELGIAGT